MTHPQVPGVRAASIRVALGATLVVAAVYVVIAAAVVVIATRNLTAQIDDQLASALIHVGNEPARPPNQGLEPPPGREGPFETTPHRVDHLRGRDRDVQRSGRDPAG